MTDPDKRLLKAVEKLNAHYIHVTPHYRKDGEAALVEIQDVINGVAQPPFVMSLRTTDEGLSIRSSAVNWQELETVVPKPGPRKRVRYTDIEKKFTLIQNPFDPSEGDHFQHHETLGYPLNRVWTVMEGDNGKGWYPVTGYHIVNAICYLVSEEEWTDADSDINWKY